MLLRYGLNVPRLQVSVSEGQSQRWGTWRMQTWSWLGRCHYETPVFLWSWEGLSGSYHGGAMPWNLQNTVLHKHFLSKVSQPQAFHYGYRKFILLLQFPCRVLACLLWLWEGHSFPVLELCWSHLADLLWGQAQGMLCANLNCFPLSSGQTQWMSQHLQRGREDCDLGLLVVKNQRDFSGKTCSEAGKFLNTGFEKSRPFSLDLLF